MNGNMKESMHGDKPSCLKPKHKNMALVMLCYVNLYSFLAVMYFLMLKGAMAGKSGGPQTLLWTFFFLGVLFSSVVTLGVHMSQREEEMKRLAEDSSDWRPTKKECDKLEANLISNV